MSKLRSDELVIAQAEYQSLLDTARLQEGHMAIRSLEKKGPATRALENLGKTKISFGNPRDNFVRLSTKLFSSVGLNLDAVQRQKLKTENFYYITMAISMVPGDAVIYDQLKCSLEFSPDGERGVIIHSMFPEAKWKDILTYGGELNLGLNADLSWGLGLDLRNPVVNKLLRQLPTETKFNVNNSNEYKAFIAIPSFSYSMGRPEIAATGEGNNFGFWDVQKPDLKKSQTIKFGLVFKAPKQVKKIFLTGAAVAETSKNWLISNLKPLFNSFTKTQQERITKGIPIYDFKEWELKLPI